MCSLKAWIILCFIPLCRVIVCQALTATPPCPRFEQLEKQIYYVHLMSRQSLQLPYPITWRFSLAKCLGHCPLPNHVRTRWPGMPFSARKRWIRAGSLILQPTVLSLSFPLYFLCMPSNVVALDVITQMFEIILKELSLSHAFDRRQNAKRT